MLNSPRTRNARLRSSEPKHTARWRTRRVRYLRRTDAISTFSPGAHVNTRHRAVSRWDKYEFVDVLRTTAAESVEPGLVSWCRTASPRVGDECRDQQRKAPRTNDAKCATCRSLPLRDPAKTSSAITPPRRISACSPESRCSGCSRRGSVPIADGSVARIGIHSPADRTSQNSRPKRSRRARAQSAVVVEQRFAEARVDGAESARGHPGADLSPPTGARQSPRSRSHRRRPAPLSSSPTIDENRTARPLRFFGAQPAIYGCRRYRPTDSPVPVPMSSVGLVQACWDIEQCRGRSNEKAVNTHSDRQDCVRRRARTHLADRFE